MNKNLEALIEEHAKVMADQMVKAAEWASSEEDVRHECNKLIDEFVKKAGLTIKGRHEYGLAGGRIDSKYGGVVIEYKASKGPGKLTEDRNSPGVKAAVSQVKRRFLDLQAQEHVGMERIFGVGCDGHFLVFVRQRGKNIDVEDPQPVTAHNVERLLRAIVSLGARGLSFTPENLAAYFGSESQAALHGIHRFYDVIHNTKSPKAQTFFRQWQILFGEVCGYDIRGQNAKIKKLAEHYEVADPNPAELLFAVHTYYAIFIKLLAAEIVASFSPLGTSPLKLLIAAPTSTKLRDELRALEQGGIWSQLGIRNFLEGDLFSWYIDTWDDSCTEAIRAMTHALDQFDPTTLSVDPAESRDLLKQLYQQLFPRSVRHDLGEYYTPDWLAELVLDELGYDGNPDKRLLDPACGSGTFLVMALNRAKTWYEEHRFECGYGEDELLLKVLRNIIGFDLNPLAVMAARTNYLMAIRDLLRHAGNIELPIYLCDSVMTPFEHGDLFSGGHGIVRRLNTSAGDFIIPIEIAENRHQIGRYSDTLEFCIRNNYNPSEFLQRCSVEEIPVSEAELHKDLYRHLQKLNADNKNGIWARIIKNAFAPLFIGKVDFVAGNPPWVNWESLPDEYRDSMKHLWQDYGLFTLSGSAGRLGGGKKDLSMLFVYSAVDNYLQEAGKLGFVITQSVFKTQGAGDGFRCFHFKKGDQSYYLKPLIVHDLSDTQVFEGATNRAAVFVCEKTVSKFKYPIIYKVWRGPSRIDQNVSLAEAHALTSNIRMDAIPIDPYKPTSPWLTSPKRALSGIQKILGKGHYRAYEGVNTGGLNGCFWVRVIERRPDGNLLIENLFNVGKIKVKHVHAVIEPNLVFQLLRGRDVLRWKAIPSASIILAQDPLQRRGIAESVMKREYPQTYSYLKLFEGNPKRPERGTLRGRALYRKYYDPSDPFYSMYNVGPYTLAKWKVQWQHTGVQWKMRSCVTKQKLIGDQKVIFVPFNNKNDANYFCACLNSSPIFYGIKSYIVLDASPHVIEHFAIPEFDERNPLHLKLADLSERCHTASAKDDSDSIAGLETEIDSTVARLWGINAVELRDIQEALDEMSTRVLQQQVEEDDD